MASLYEHRRGEVSFETTHDFLYHMTDHHGFAYTINQDSLQSFRDSTISTTYDPKKDSVFGYMHYDFKFVLHGRALVRDYGGFSYDHYIRVQGDDGRTRYRSLKEKELRLNTNEVTPFSNYLIGTVLLMDVFSQKAIQWLLYDNFERKSFFDSRAKTESPRAVEMLYRHVYEWGKPIWIGRHLRDPNEDELAFIRDVHDIHARGGDFDSAMRDLAARYPIKDHWGKELDRTMVIRRQMADEIVDRYNDYFAGRRIVNTNPDASRKLFSTSMKMLDLGNNAETILMAKAEKMNLFHPLVAPVDWSIVYRHLFDGDIEGGLEAMDWVGKEKARSIRYWELDEKGKKYGVHAGTRFG